MDMNFRKLDEVWTADSKKLGSAYRLFHREEEINPALQYYASYLEVESYEYGETYYVPTDFIAGRDESGKVTLTVTLGEVLRRTWLRMPDFVAQGQDRREALPEK